MADEAFVNALAQCLEALRRGEPELEACLRRHAEHRARIEPLLDVVRLIPKLPKEIVPSATFRSRTRSRFESRPNGGGAPLDWKPQPPRTS